MSWITRPGDVPLGAHADVDFATTPPTAGQAVVFDAASGLWVPGAGGSAGGTAGTATIADPATSVDVAHGQAALPSAQDFQVTPTNDLGGASKFWISAVDATHLTISIDQAPGVGLTAEFVWRYLSAEPGPGTVVLPYSTDAGMDGLVDHLGTNGGTEAFSNPVTVGGRMSVGSTASVGSNFAKTLTDKTSTTIWQSSTSSNAWAAPGASAVWDLGPWRSMSVTRVGMKSRHDANVAHPENWALEGSNDGVMWLPLASVSGAGWTAADQWKSWLATDDTPVRYLRARLTGNNSSGGSAFLAGGIEFWGTLTDTTPDTTYPLSSTFLTPGVLRAEAAIASASGSVDGTRVPANAIDGDVSNTTSAYWHSSSMAGSWIKFDLGAGKTTIPYRYDVMSRPDSGTLTPHGFKLQGSNDDATWGDLDARPNPNLGISREFEKAAATWRTFWVSTPSTAYRYLRLLLTNPGPEGDYLVLGEVEVYGDVIT